MEDSTQLLRILREATMLANQLLERKGRTVATVTSDATVREALAELSRWDIGALVVSDDGTTVAGLVSERDVARRLASDGTAVLEAPVRDIMRSDVVTCDGAAECTWLMGVMTERRIRHVPVVEGGQLVGIVSIGDVVKARVDELAREASHLTDYIRAGY